MLTLLRDSAVLALLDPESRDAALESAAVALRALRPDLFAAPVAAAPAKRARTRAAKSAFGLTEAVRLLKADKVHVHAGAAYATDKDGDVWLSFPCTAPDGTYDPDLALRQKKPVNPGDGFCPRTLPTFDLPPATGDVTGSVSYDPADLTHVLQGVSSEETRYYLRGVFFGTDLVSTNGHICLIRPCSGDTPNAIVPTLAVTAALKLGLDSLTFHANHVSGPGFVAKLIDGQFPEYKRILPQETESPVQVAYLPDMAKNDVLIARDGKTVVVDTKSGALVAGDAAMLAAYRETRARVEELRGARTWDNRKQVDSMIEQLEADSPVGFHGPYIAICCDKADFTVRLAPGLGASYINDAVIMPKRL